MKMELLPSLTPLQTACKAVFGLPVHRYVYGRSAPNEPIIRRYLTMDKAVPVRSARQGFHLTTQELSLWR